MARRSQAKRKTQQIQHNQEDFGSFNNKKNKRSKNSRKHRSDESNIVDLRSQQLATAYSPPKDKQILQARNNAQKRYIHAIKHHNLTFGLGPAGTGKSYCAAALAAQALESGRIERIILTRPAVEAGENLGFLPGDVDDKFAVYIDAFRDILNERLGAGTVDYCLRHGRIVAAPLAYMRGKTFKQDTFVVLDEAQNTTPSQMKMFLTRIGDNCRVVINGDVAQSDIVGVNGLQDAVARLEGLGGVYVHQFERKDIVRSGLVRDIIDCYEGTAD